MDPAHKVGAITPREDKQVTPPPPSKKNKFRSFLQSIISGGKKQKGVSAPQPASVTPDPHGLEEYDKKGEEILVKAVKAVKAEKSVHLGRYTSSSEDEGGEKKVPALPLSPMTTSSSYSASGTRSTATSRSSSHSPVTFLGQQLEMRDRELLGYLREREIYPWLWDAMCLCNEAIIDTGTLFSLITEQGGDFLHDFCRLWLKENKDTKLAASARRYLDGKVALEPAPPLRLTAKVPRLNFNVVQIQLGTGNLSQLELIAQDLLHKQRELYTAIDAHGFIEDKRDETQKQSVRRFLGFQRKICHFAVDAILREKNLDKRIDLVIFFLNICMVSLKLNDFATAASLGRFIRDARITLLTSTMEEITPIPEVGILLEQFDRLAEDKHIEEVEEMTEPCIPYITPYIMRLQEQNGRRAVDSGHYNLSKLQEIYRTIHAFLAHKERWLGQKEGKMETDFITAYLDTFQPMSENEREVAAFELKEKKV